MKKKRVHTIAPVEVSERIRAVLDGEGCLDQVRIAFRERTGEEYTIVWPKGLSSFQVA